jgi:hypothetical protein
MIIGGDFHRFTGLARKLAKEAIERDHPPSASGGQVS